MAQIIEVNLLAGMIDNHFVLPVVVSEEFLKELFDSIHTDPKMIVQMPEGTMEVEIREDGEIFLTGDVGYVGSISLGSYFTEQLKLV